MSIRLFAEHSIRPAIPLDGLWEFVTASERTDQERLPHDYSRSIYVPSCWEQIPGLESYRGKAWFRTTLSGTEHMAARLVFGGVSHTATVFVDGEELGRHYDAYTPWDIVIPELSEGGHELVVEVDNSFGPDSALHRENDYYTYGGITRPVELQFVPPVYIGDIAAVPYRKDDDWELSVRIQLNNWSDQPLVRSLVLMLGEDRQVHWDEITIPPHDIVDVTKTLNELDVQSWSEEYPTLYELTVLLLEDEEIVDDLNDRVGFRAITVEGRNVLLNGQPIHLRGYNRHEDHPQFGCALPVEAMMHDIHLLKDLGCNFIRTSHYPNDRRFLDLCDELGIYVWEESHYRQVPIEHPKLREQLEGSTREMIDAHLNHPSIIMWGCLNESDSWSEPGYDLHAWMLGLIKELDPSRPITYASHGKKDDRCAGLADIIAWNHYWAWYVDQPGTTAEYHRDHKAWLHSEASRGGKGKPIIMSEFGAGAIYGCRHPNRAAWTEEHQCDVLDDCLQTYLYDPDVVGVAIWQFCDIRITPGQGDGGHWSRRPRSMNNKGTVDEYRRPKLVYEVVKHHMHAAKSHWENH